MTLYLGTTPIAGSMSAETLVDTLYPVGSCYIGTGSTCPLAAIKGTWTLQSSGVITSVDTNVPVKGNGIALGLTNGSTNFALDGLGSSGHPNLKPSEYGTNVGTQTGSISGNIAGAMGVTTDASKSGVVGTVTSSTLSVNIWQRTA